MTTCSSYYDCGSCTSDLNCYWCDTDYSTGYCMNTPTCGGTVISYSYNCDYSSSSSSWSHTPDAVWVVPVLWSSLSLCCICAPIIFCCIIFGVYQRKQRRRREAMNAPLVANRAPPPHMQQQQQHHQQQQPPSYSTYQPNYTPTTGQSAPPTSAPNEYVAPPQYSGYEPAPTHDISTPSAPPDDDTAYNPAHNPYY